jgi:hypothetical protein
MHVLDIAKNIIPHIQGQSIIQVYSPEQLRDFQFWERAPGTCLGCGNQMSQGEMLPSGRSTPRAFCQACWQNVPWGACQVCFRPLDYAKQEAQRRSPLDAHNRVHEQGYMANERPCLDLFAIGSAHVLGVRVGLLETEAWYQPRQRRMPQQAQAYQYQQGNMPRQGMMPQRGRMMPNPNHTMQPDEFMDDVMDAEYYEVARQLPPGMRRALPPPDNSWNIKEILKNMRGTRTDGKPVVYVRLKNAGR